MNKTNSTLACILLTALLSVSANAAIIWKPTDVLLTGDVNIPFFGLSIGTGMLALFEDTAALTSGNALTLGSSGGIFAFTDNQDGNFTVESLVGGVSQGSKVIAGNEFILAVTWGNGYVANSSITQDLGDPTSYLIGFDDGRGNTGTSLAIDLTPVPLPAAMWLFATGLFALVATKRRQA